VPDEERIRAAIAGAERHLNAWHGAPPPRETLAALAEATGADERIDRYGSGERIERLERRVAELLGKEAAVFMPSGTMAQPIALRVWSDRRGTATVAFHPTCHLELHEERAYQALHGLRARHVGDPNRLIALEDLEAIREPVAALLLELPQREIGGRLPPWDDLVAQTEWARRREIALHLDGARLWNASAATGIPSGPAPPAWSAWKWVSATQDGAAPFRNARVRSSAAAVASRTAVMSNGLTTKSTAPHLSTLTAVSISR